MIDRAAKIKVIRAHRHRRGAACPGSMRCPTAFLLDELARVGAAAKTVLEGFEAGVFVRDVRHDDDPAWAIRLFPYLRAIAVLQGEEPHG